MDGVKDRSFYALPEWRKLREKILRRDHFMDQWQKRFGKMEEAETVHHVFMLQERPELAFDPRNLVSVSRHTHAYILHKPDGSLTEAGRELQRVTARKYNI